MSTNKTESFFKRNEALLSIVVSGISAILAIGAYSEDSLFWKRIVRPSAFSVRSTVTMHGETAEALDAYALKRTTKTGPVLIPLQALIYVAIRNESPHSQGIDAIKLEIQHNGLWRLVTLLETQNGLFTGWGAATNEVMQANVPYLLDSLGEKVLQPHELVSGWVMVELPADLRNEAVSYDQMRMTLYSGFGEQETHPLFPPVIGPGITATREPFLTPMKTAVKLDEARVMSTSEFWKEVNKMR